MKTNKTFTIKRLYFLLQRDIKTNLRPYLIGLGAIAGLLLLILVFDSYYRGHINYEPFVSTFLMIFTIGGLVFTSRIFSEIHQPEKSYYYLTLPASTLEKLVSQWLLSAVGVILVAYTGVYLVGYIGGLMSSALFGMDFYALNLAEYTSSETWLKYLVVHSIFFLGAVAFRNNNFIKTLLAIFVIGFIIAAFTGGLSYILFSGEELKDGNVWLSTFDLFPGLSEDVMNKLVDAVIRYIIAPFFLVVSYFKLKERQV
ncbi:MAG: hypothetical protein ACLFNL_10720 [Bacteroidales bacterium]